MHDRATIARAKTVAITLLLAQRGIHLVCRGARLTAACPIHGGDNDRAFVVDEARNLWYCFTACQRGGDVIDLVRLLDRSSFPAALAALGPLASKALLADHHAPCESPLHQPAASHRPPPIWCPYTREIPLKPDDPWLRGKGIQPATARRFEIGRHHGRGFLADCIGVRLHDHRGQPLGYAARHLDPDDVRRFGRWKYPQGIPKARILYGFHRVLQPLDRPLVLVECPWGVLRLAQLAIPAVALLGTHLTAHHLALLRPIDRITLLLDADPAGHRAASLAQDRLTALGHHVTTVRLPPGADPDDLADPDLAALLC